MDFSNIQEQLLSMLPLWNCWITKPLKRFLDDGISLEMYYCIKTIQCYGEPLTMSELARYTMSSKQQMTKVVNRLVKHELAERIYDSSNRRIIKIKITEKALFYIDHFIEYHTDCFRPFLEQMSKEDLEDFKKGIELVSHSLVNLPWDSYPAEITDGTDE